MKSKLLVALCYILSATISFVIIMHSYTYLIGIFEYSAFLIFSLVTLIEMLYISIPYIATFATFVANWDKILIGLLFFLSVVPATLQTTSAFHKEIDDRVIVAPIVPERSPLIRSYQRQIGDLTNQIKGNQDIIKDMVAQQFITKADRYRKQNSELNTSKNDLIQKSNTLQTEYNKKKTYYNKQMQQYETTEAKENLNNFFDYLKLTWTLLLISIFQLVNSRLAYHGTSILTRIKDQVLETEIINKAKVEVDESPKTPITREFLLENFKTSGIGKGIAKNFMERYSLKTAEDLRSFIETEFESRLERDWPHETAKSLKNFCRKIKRNTLGEKEDEYMERLFNREKEQ